MALALNNLKRVDMPLNKETKQFDCKKTFLFQAILFSQTVLIQTIQFSISIVFVYT